MQVTPCGREAAAALWSSVTCCVCLISVLPQTNPTIALLTDVEAETQGDAHTVVTSFQSQAAGWAACIEAGVIWGSSKQGHPWVPRRVGSKPFKPWTQRDPLVCRSQGSISEAENHPTCKVGKFSSPSGTGGLL